MINLKMDRFENLKMKISFRLFEDTPKLAACSLKLVALGKEHGNNLRALKLS